jgi:peptidyl-prolyl cis-trans isomerase A (cyclophilin A)
MRLAACLLCAAAVARADVTPPPPAGPNGPPRELTLDEATAGLGGHGPLRVWMKIEGAASGELTCALYPSRAPRTVANFVGLARGLRAWKDPKSGQWVRRPFYDGLTFHRVIPEFVIQGGDAKGDGTGDPGYKFEDEGLEESLFAGGGVLAMANAGPNTNGSQFFITEKPSPWLDHHHVVFGDCAPLDLVKKIARVPRQSNDRPTTPVRIAKVRVFRVQNPR